MRSRGALLAAAALCVTAASADRAHAAVDRFAVCAECHGEGGVSQSADTPSLAGQPSFYAITQLFLFREGRRSNPSMSDVTKGMSDTDLRFYSELIGRLPAAAPYQPALADPAKVARGAALAARYRCASCHGSDLSGGKQVPRLAGQREDYLRSALAGFRAGTRIGYTPAMNETLAGIGAADLDDLAHYLAHAPGAVGPADAASAGSR